MVLGGFVWNLESQWLWVVLAVPLVFLFGGHGLSCRRLDGLARVCYRQAWAWWGGSYRVLGVGFGGLEGGGGFLIVIMVNMFKSAFLFRNIIRTTVILHLVCVVFIFSWPHGVVMGLVKRLTCLTGFSSLTGSDCGFLVLSHLISRCRSFYSACQGLIWSLSLCFFLRPCGVSTLGVRLVDQGVRCFPRLRKSQDYSVRMSSFTRFLTNFEDNGGGIRVHLALCHQPILLTNVVTVFYLAYSSSNKCI